MTLEAYHQKRKFSSTPEPEGKRSAKTRDSLTFVVQKHNASSLHYDLRLEMDGVLKSWAVPKGPSLDPSVKRLAIHVEDHPLEYARFEGVISAGNYGAGNVIVWDIGTWQPVDGKSFSYLDGSLKFELFGEKLQGRWALVRVKQTDKSKQSQWLLIKERDPYAVAERTYVVTSKYPRSVLTGRDVFELSSPPGVSTTPTKKNSALSTSRSAPKFVKPGQLAKIPGIQKATLPAFLAPQLATPATAVPEGSQWLHEIKFDGYRLIAVKEESTNTSPGRVTIKTRNQHDWTNRFPNLATSLKKLTEESFVIDGEVAFVKENGVTDFGALQNFLKEGKQSQLVYHAFDILYFAGYDLRNCNLKERKALLKSLIGSSSDSRLQFSDHVEGNGTEFFEKCRAAGVEGVISKRSDSKYKPGRSGSWLKCKCILSDDFVVGGYVRSEARKDSIRSLIVGYFRDSEFVYAGKVGSGFSESLLNELKHICQPLSRRKSPFQSQPAELSKDKVVWTEPSVVVRVHYIGWTNTRQLRHAVFMGLRQDIDSRQVIEPLLSAEETQVPRRKKSITPVTANLSPEKLVALADINLTNPQKILFPSDQLTKLDLVKYYVGVAEKMLDYHRDRPVSLLRFPDGIEQANFFQKHPLDGMHPSIVRVEDPESSSQKPFLEISNLSGLASAVQLGTVEFHPWSARSDRLDRPDRVIFDFDPDTSVKWEQVKDAALACHEILNSLGISSFVKTSGGKGVHVVVPIERRSTWEEALSFAKGVAKRMEQDDKQRFTSNMSKQARVGKILIDVHRNHRGSTCVGAYSLRARPKAPVSMPLTWRELKKVEDPRDFNIESASRRVSRRDPWAGFYAVRQSITKSVTNRLLRLLR